MARVVMYNFTDEKRRRAVKAILFRMLIPVREVVAEEQALPLGIILGAPGFPTPEAETGSAEDAKEAPFPDEMLVMHGLTKRQFSGLLDTLKREGISIPLKAVVTPHNIGWSSGKLYREIQAEHAAMTGKQP